MDQPGRFQRNERLRSDGDIVTSLGVDVVTGLAVLIYDFPGEPRARPGGQAVPGIPTVVASWADGGQGTLVVAYPSDATLVAPGESIVDDQFVLQALTVLRDASGQGLVHGDIHPGRFLWAERRLYLEGYGVPWRRGQPAAPAVASSTVGPGLSAALREDLRRAAAALLELGAKGISAEVAAALGSAAAGTSGADATGLQAIVRRLAGGAVKVPSAGFGDIVLPVSSAGPAEEGPPLDLDALEFTPQPQAPVADLDFDPHDVAGVLGAAPSVSATRTDMRVDPAAYAARPEQAADAAAVTPHGRGPGRQPPPTPTPVDEPDPITLHSDPGAGVLKTGPVGKAPPPEGAFVKNLPPGATYRAGTLEDALRPAPIRLDGDIDGRARRRSLRGPALLLLLVLALALGSFLALRAQRSSGLGNVEAGTVRHLVDVRVTPGNLPPVSLVVDRSPDGSLYSPGTIIGSVPRRVAFDANGVWVVHAQFQGRSSESVTLRVPDESVITIAFPEPSTTSP